jgi:multicomponent Na+:H+ antiporter subunit D
LATRREAPLGLLVPAWILVIATLYFGLETSVTVGSAANAAAMLLGLGR